ncbi:MAG: hypothetical protein AAB428_03460 [Patescibacteria group bacterium]
MGVKFARRPGKPARGLQRFVKPSEDEVMETGLWFVLAGGVIGAFFSGISDRAPVIGSLAGLVAYFVLSHWFGSFLASVN